MRKRTKMATVRRPERPLREMESYIDKDPDLHKALRLFEIGMKQYARTLAYLSRPQVISRADTASADTP